jgi:hypothetical protein
VRNGGSNAKHGTVHLNSVIVIVIAIAGTASIGLEFVPLFQVELEHYEKMDGSAGSSATTGHHCALLHP